MYNDFIINIECSKCNKIFCSGNRDSSRFTLDVSFQHGKLSFVCPECFYLNEMLFIKDEKVKSINGKLPNLIIRRQ